MTDSGPVPSPEQPRRTPRTYTGWLRARRQATATPAPGEPGGRGSQEAKDALVLHGLIRVASGLDREQVMDLLGWDGYRLDAALGVLRRLKAS